MENIQQLIQEFVERMVRIETKLDNYNSYREKTDEAHVLAKANEKRLDKIEDSHKWLWRTIVGAIIVGGVTAFLKWKGL